jgi:hypothetical protein
MEEPYADADLPSSSSSSSSSAKVSYYAGIKFESTSMAASDFYSFDFCSFET